MGCQFGRSGSSSRYVVRFHSLDTASGAVPQRAVVDNAAGLAKVTQFVITVSAVDLWCILWIRKLSLLMGELT